MDPKLFFWLGALVYTVGMIGSAVAAWRAIRGGDLARHRRLMNLTVVLVGIFVAAYVLKVVFLGKESLETWPRIDVIVLRVHETFILAMLVAGTMARLAARRFHHADDRADGVRGVAVGTRRLHRRAGRTAVTAGVLALLTAGFILVRMFLRALA